MTQAVCGVAWQQLGANLVAAKEREACAKLCEEAGDDEFYTGIQYADNIRSRKETI